MQSLNDVPRDLQVMESFSKDLGSEIELTLTEKKHEVHVFPPSLYKETRFVIYWVYHEKHFGALGVSQNEEMDGDCLLINNYLGVRPCYVLDGGRSSLPEELRGAAQIYDEVTSFLVDKFGDPISEHEDRLVYRASLEQGVV